MKAREGVMSSPDFGDNLNKLYPVVEPEMSDSGCLDNVVEFLVMVGNRSLPEAMMTMVITNHFFDHELRLKVLNVYMLCKFV